MLVDLQRLATPAAPIQSGQQQAYGFVFIGGVVVLAAVMFAVVL